MLGMVQIAMLLALIRGGAALSFSQTNPNLHTQRSIQWSTSLGIQPFDILKRPVHA